MKKRTPYTQQEIELAEKEGITRDWARQKLRAAKGICAKCGEEPVDHARSKRLGANCLPAKWTLKNRGRHPIPGGPKVIAKKLGISYDRARGIWENMRPVKEKKQDVPRSANPSSSGDARPQPAA